ncbi:tripartite motif-containing protein 6-like, partial [Homarus americanus]|uniref:tripartite motif-containing protein 6-like n=1 Tax=Homarus americanus TaxID=6706 RepID=UPI001C4536A9
MDNDKPEECKVCFDNFDEALRRPRSLPCGHTFCTVCIVDMIKNSQFTCPTCRADHNTLALTDVTQLPINYGMESFIRRLKGVSLKPAQTKAPTKRPQDGPRGISKKLRSLLQEEMNKVISLITACDEKLSQLGKYGKKVNDLKTGHNLLEDRLNGLLEQNKAAKELVEQEETSVEDMSTEGEEEKQQLQAVLEYLNTVNSLQEFHTAIEDADRRSVVTEDWIHKCQEQFPNVNTVHTSVKVQESIRLALDMIPTEAVATAAPLHLGDSASTILEKFDEITTIKLTVDDLGRMTEGVKRQVLEAGRVYAVHQDQHGLRSSRITTQDGRLYLHTLQSQPAPLHAHTIQFTDVVGAPDCSSTLV